MILPIYIYGHPILRSECENIDPSYEGLEELIENMFETMHNAHGIGLSAPQIGLSINLFIIDLSPYAEDEPSFLDMKEVFINPEILEESGELLSHNEGCLSIPGVREDVDRKSIIKLKYLDQNFVEHVIDISGIFARVVQHEYDHLHKTLFIDYLSAIKKNIVNRKLNSIVKGKFKEEYPTILKK
tara:strand:+ start:238 stop:792 length:555 start_codon:yes stop_codon:yes gene_type:complete